MPFLQVQQAGLNSLRVIVHWSKLLSSKNATKSGINSPRKRRRQRAPPAGCSRYWRCWGAAAPLRSGRRPDQTGCWRSSAAGHRTASQLLAAFRGPSRPALKHTVTERLSIDQYNILLMVKVTRFYGYQCHYRLCSSIPNRFSRCFSKNGIGQLLYYITIIW